MHEGSWMEQQQVSLIIISIPSDVISVLALSTFKQLHADFWVRQCGKFPPAGFRGKTYSVLQNAVLKTNYVGLLSVKTGQCLQEADSLTARLWSPTFFPLFFFLSASFWDGGGGFLVKAHIWRYFLDFNPMQIGKLITSMREMELVSSVRSWRSATQTTPWMKLSDTFQNCSAINKYRTWLLFSSVDAFFDKWQLYCKIDSHWTHCISLASLLQNKSQQSVPLCSMLLMWNWSGLKCLFCISS